MKKYDVDIPIPHILGKWEMMTPKSTFSMLNYPHFDGGNQPRKLANSRDRLPDCLGLETDSQDHQNTGFYHRTHYLHREDVDNQHTLPCSGCL